MKIFIKNEYNFSFFLFKKCAYNLEINQINLLMHVIWYGKVFVTSPVCNRY